MTENATSFEVLCDELGQMVGDSEIGQLEFVLPNSLQANLVEDAPLWMSLAVPSDRGLTELTELLTGYKPVFVGSPNP